MLLRSRSRRVCPQADPLAQATDACNQGTDPPFFSVRYINSYVGSGVFCNRQFHKGDFLLEYRGELISLHEGVEREKSYPTSKGNFLYFFDYGNSRKCIDATKADGFARMINDGVKRANCKMRVVLVEEKLRLCLFAAKDLRKGEELFFDYGVKDLPWRKEGWEGDSDGEEKVSKRPRKTSRRTEGNTPKESTENEVNKDNAEDEYIPDSCEEEINDDYEDTWEPSGQSPKKGMQKKKKDVLQWQVNAKDEGSRAGSARYRKPVRRCPFCLNVYHEKLSRHIKIVHKDIEMVAAALKLPRKARDAAFNLMKKEGIRISNREEVKSATPSFQRERNTITNCSLVMCNLCRGFYSKRFFSRHKRKCQEEKCLNSWSIPTSFPTCEPKTKRRRPEINRVAPSNYEDVNVEEMLHLNETLVQVNDAKYKRPMRKCPFCLKFYSEKLSFHIRTIHKDNERVAVALRLPKKERDTAFRLMKKEGILINNKEEMNSVTPRFQRERKAKSKDTLVMCGLCKGFYSKKRIGRHRDVCQGSSCLESSLVPTSSCKKELSDERSSKDVPCNLGGNNMKEIYQVLEKESEIFDEKNDGKYRKPTRKCPFCLKLYTAKLSRHIQFAHKDIEKVSEALKLPEKARIKAFDLMKKEGILIANRTQMLSATPKFQRERRTNSKDPLVMCEGCKGFYSKIFFPRHKVNCQGTNCLTFSSQSTSLSLSEPPVKKSRRSKRKKSGIEIPAKRNRPRVKKVSSMERKLQVKDSSSGTLDQVADRHYKKPSRKCPFCLTFYQEKLSRHIRTAHKDNEKVAAAMKLPREAQSAAFNLMKKEGILITNMEEMKSAKPMYHQERRTRSKHSLVVCGSCKGFYSKKFLPRHKVKCQGGVFLKSCSTPFPFVASDPLYEIGRLEFQRRIICKFQNDDLGEICRSDPVIESVGRRLWNIEQGNQKKKPEETCRKVMWDMRRLASLYKNFVEQSRIHDRCQRNELGGNVRDMFDCSNFNTLSASIFSYTSHERNPSVKSAVRFNLYYLLKKWCNMIKAADVSEGKEDDGIDRFLLVLEMNRGRLFGDAVMQVTGNHQKQTTQSDLPFEDDIQKLRMHILAEMSWMLKGDLGVWDHWTFARLRDLTVSRLTLLNSWRGSEPCCMLLEDWQQVDSSSGRDEQLLVSFEDPLRKQLPSSFKVRYQTCKGNNHQHPILCPAECISAMEILTNKETRSAAGIKVNNQYVFAFGEGSTDHVSFWYALDRLCKDAGVEANLTAVMNRRHISVLYTTLEVPEGKRRPFFESEAHSEENSASINGAPAMATEVESVGKELSQVGEGKKRQHPESLLEEEGPTTETTRYEPAARPYTKWNSRDEILVKKHFHDIISGCGSKCIPGRRDVDFFLKHYKLSVPLSWMTVRTKVMNERNKWHRVMKVQQKK